MGNYPRSIEPSGEIPSRRNSLISVENDDGGEFRVADAKWVPLPEAEAFAHLSQDRDGTIVGIGLLDGEKYRVDPDTGKALEKIGGEERKMAA